MQNKASNSFLTSLVGSSLPLILLFLLPVLKYHFLKSIFVLGGSRGNKNTVEAGNTETKN